MVKDHKKIRCFFSDTIHLAEKGGECHNHPINRCDAQNTLKYLFRDTPLQTMVIIFSPPHPNIVYKTHKTRPKTFGTSLYGHSLPNCDKINLTNSNLPEESILNTLRYVMLTLNVDPRPNHPQSQPPRVLCECPG